MEVWPEGRELAIKLPELSGKDWELGALQQTMGGEEHSGTAL